MKNKLMQLVRGEEGQGLTEYGLVLGVIAVAVVGILVLLKDEIYNMYNDALTTIRGRSSTTTTTTGG